MDVLERQLNGYVSEYKEFMEISQFPAFFYKLEQLLKLEQSHRNMKVQQLRHTRFQRGSTLYLSVQI